MLKIGNLSEERKEEEKMKKKMGFAVLSIAAFMFAIHSASALTEYKFDILTKDLYIKALVNPLRPRLRGI